MLLFNIVNTWIQNTNKWNLFSDTTSLVYPTPKSFHKSPNNGVTIHQLCPRTEWSWIMKEYKHEWFRYVNVAWGYLRMLRASFLWCLVQMCRQGNLFVLLFITSFLWYLSSTTFYISNFLLWYLSIILLADGEPICPPIYHFLPLIFVQHNICWATSLFLFWYLSHIFLLAGEPLLTIYFDPPFDRIFVLHKSVGLLIYISIFWFWWMARIYSLISHFF